MESYIHHIATKVPEHAYTQDYACERMKAWVREPRLRRLVHAIYGRSGIEKRHSVIGDFARSAAEARLFCTGADGELLAPGTGARNALYAEAARGLAVEVAREALAGCGAVEARDVTHVVFASCTGFCNPGPDYHVVRELGLRDSVERYTLGFMGCYAAFPALRMARQFCAADPEAVVLVICLELCSLHIQVNDRPDTLLANSLFADGAAAAVVSARVPGDAHYRLEDFASSIVPGSEGDMAWEIGDTGFNIMLSTYVPDVIGTNIRPLVLSVLERAGRTLEEIELWAVHPGGRAILDKVEAGLLLAEEALAASRGVLRGYGNMSSATILFVLKRMLDEGADGAMCAMAFGPGLTVETALLEACVPATRRRAGVQSAGVGDPGYSGAAL